MSYGTGTYGSGTYGGGAATINPNADAIAEVCAVTEVQYSSLSWTATSLGATFLQYEIQRSGDSGTTWETISIIQTESLTAFFDYEARRNQQSCYRMRVVNTSSAPSAWSATVCVDPQMVASGAVLFVSNENPALNTGYSFEGPKEYVFNDAERVVIYPLYGRDYQVAFQETETRGDSGVLNLIISAISAPINPGRAVFNAILGLAHAQLTYVAILDYDGNRWFSNISVPSGIRQERGAIYTVPVNWMQTTDTPSTPPDGE